MNRQLRYITVAASMALTALGGGSNTMSRFEWKCPLEGVFSAGEQGKLMIAGDIFGRARNYPQDLRLFGNDGTQWPYFLYTPKEADGYTRVALSVLNTSFVSGSNPYLQFDIEVPAVDGKSPVHNQLELHVSGYDYIRRVEVFTDDGKPSGLLGSGYLIDFSRQQDAQNRIIRYPDSDKSRLHIRIYPNAQSLDETFELASAQLRYRVVQKIEKETVDAQMLELPEREKEKDAQSFLYDLDNINRPVEFVSFSLSKASYARCVSVYGRNTVHDPWRRVGGGQIHQLNGDADNTISVRARHRFLKVNIFHYDDLPLDISAIQFEAVPRYMVFEASSAGSAAVYYQAWDVKAPRFDLQGRINKEVVEQLPVVRTLEAEPNQSATLQSWRAYSKLLAALAVGAVSLLVIWVMVSMIRQQKLAGEE